MGLWVFIRNQWDRVGAVAFAIAGAIAMDVAWLKVSWTLNTGEQLPYVVSAAMVGLFLLQIAALMWIAADLRDEWRKLDDIERHLKDRGDLPGG